MTQPGKGSPFVWEWGVDCVEGMHDSPAITSALGVTTMVTPDDAVCFSSEAMLEILSAADKPVPGWTPLPTLMDLNNPRACTRSDCITPVEICRAMHRAFEEIRELHPSLLRWASKKNVQRLKRLLRQTRTLAQGAGDLWIESRGKVECFEQIARTSKLLEQHVETVGTMVRHQNKLAQKGGASLVIKPLKRCYQAIFRETPSGGWKSDTASSRVNHADSAFIRFATRFCAVVSYPVAPETLQDALYRSRSAKG